jgi:hypothetical protein
MPRTCFSKCAFLSAFMLSLVLVVVAGCGGQVKSLSEADAKRLLERDAVDVKAFADRARGILASGADVQSLASRLDTATKEYEVFWPGVFEKQEGSGKWEQAVGRSKDKGRKTVYGSLYGLAEKKLVVQDGRQSSAASVGDNISKAANKYYVALDYLYSLRDFEDLLARYTTGDGTKVKRDNPPPASATGFGAFASTFIGFGWNRETGDLILTKYLTDPQFDTSGQQVTVAEVEQFFIAQASERIKEADSIATGLPGAQSAP